MIVESRRWPANLPEELIAINAKMDEELSKIPVLDIGMFALREVQVTYLGAQGMTMKESATALYLSYETVKTHRHKAFMRTPAGNIHGLTYRMMHSGWFAYTYDAQAAEAIRLEPVQSLLLKGFALGKTEPELLAQGVTTESKMSSDVRMLGARLGVENRQVLMVSRAYEVRTICPGRGRPCAAGNPADTDG